MGNNCGGCIIRQCDLERAERQINRLIQENIELKKQIDELKTTTKSQAAEECPGSDCLMCSGEVCVLCGAGCWADLNRPKCEHDVVERHQEQHK